MQEQTPHAETTFALDRVTFRVPGRTLLHPLSLTFPSGKVTGLIGHNGSGKSTLLKMLGRHQPPSAGEVLLDGQPLESWGSKAFARKVAYLPQQLPPAEGMMCASWWRSAAIHGTARWVALAQRTVRK